MAGLLQLRGIESDRTYMFAGWEREERAEPNQKGGACLSEWTPLYHLVLRNQAPETGLRDEREARRDKGKLGRQMSVVSTEEEGSGMEEGDEGKHKGNGAEAAVGDDIGMRFGVDMNAYTLCITIAWNEKSEGQNREKIQQRPRKLRTNQGTTSSCAGSLIFRVGRTRDLGDQIGVGGWQ
ncbi:hypothetical protein GX48_05715 [Paracoccidioides brasiliensis]|nr:hypothetical protein GX48_05715 [Paracoccidioides brasiliensis]